jgi:hypothetical protein
MPGVSTMAVERRRASRQSVSAAAGPARPSAALPARRTLSAASLAARHAEFWREKRATWASGNESSHAAA